MFSRDALRQLGLLLRPIRIAIANTVARGVVKISNDGKRLQVLQLGVLAGEAVDDVERFQEYGFTSNPPAGAEAVALFPGGDRSRGMVVATDDRRYRPRDWELGESGLYNGPAGTLLKLANNGDVFVTDDEDDPGEAVGRVGDAVEVVIPAGTVIIPNPAPPPDTVPNPIDIVLVGTIVSGSSILKAK